MIQLILLFFPTFISLWIVKKREKNEDRELIFLYPIYNIFINIFTFFTIFLIKKREATLLSTNIDSIGFIARFLLLATTISIIIPYLKEFIFKNIKVEIEIRKAKKENAKDK